MLHQKLKKWVQNIWEQNIYQFGILKEGDSIAVRTLVNLNANIKTIYEDILKVITENASEENKIKNKLERE